MRFTIEKKEFTKALDRVAGVVERKSTVPVLSNVLLAQVGDNLWLTGTDLDIEVRACAPVNSGHHTGEVTVDASALSQIIRKMSDGAEIELSYDERDDPRLIIKSGRSRFSLSVLPAQHFPVMGDTPDDTVWFDMSSALLADMIEQVRYAVSREQTRYYLCGAYMHVTADKTGLRLVATDGHRLGLTEAPVPPDAVGISGVIVPLKTINAIHGLVQSDKGSIRIGVSKTRIAARGGGTDLQSKIIDGSFPDYERVVPTSNENVMTVDTKLMAQVVDRVSTISTDKARSVKMELSRNEATLGARSVESGSANEAMAVNYDGPDLSIGFNAKYAQEVLSKIKTEQTEFRFADSSGPVLVLAVGGSDQTRHVLMPLRV